MGFATGAADRRCVFTQSQDAAADSVVDEGHRADACIAVMDTAGAVVGIGDFNTMLSNGFQVIIDDQFPSAIRVSYLAVGGSDITNVETGSFQAPTAAGNQDVTVAFGQPDTTLFLGSWIQAAPPSTGAGQSVSFGAAVSSAQRGVVETVEEDAQMAADNADYGYSGEVVAISNVSNAGAIVHRADFVQMQSTGFRVNWLEVHGTNQAYVHFLAIKGGSWRVDNLLTQTDTSTDIVESGFGFQPAFALFASACRALSTQDTPSSHIQWSVGAFDSISSRVAQCVYGQDAALAMVNGFGVEHDEVYLNVSPSTEATQGLMDVKSVESGGFTCIMDDADPSQSWVMYWSGGAAPAAAKAPPPFQKHTLYQWRTN
jgi:hypothetical protein